MKKRVFMVVMIFLTAVVLQTTARIELANIRAGNYLPRSDRNPDGTLTDGTWRVSSERTPRDQLRRLVQTFGLLQYALTPLLLILAIVVFLKSPTVKLKVASSFSVFVAVIAISLMLYRGYYQSLGW